MEEPEGGRALRAPVDTQPQHRPRGLRGAVPSADRGGVWGVVGCGGGGVVGVGRGLQRQAGGVGKGALDAKSETAAGQPSENVHQEGARVKG